LEKGSFGLKASVPTPSVRVDVGLGEAGADQLGLAVLVDRRLGLRPRCCAAAMSAWKVASGGIACAAGSPTGATFGTDRLGLHGLAGLGGLMLA
jgi:hypothetical protein